MRPLPGLQGLRSCIPVRSHNRQHGTAIRRDVGSVTAHDSEEISAYLSASSHEDVEDHKEIFPQFPLLQAEQTKLSQLFLINFASSPITILVTSFEFSLITQCLFYIVVPKLPPGLEPVSQFSPIV
ncbi:hypothetical protein DUI87_27813 [Hirundo rustica rustica]|uniref:Uncharacterized protein n=1 Tax=Hirundo rustica rustica TaxID=333673 RepID=A0A3M0J5S8_HIRRU|nr:hypothetical protein DUI87_27813 [Hirundo rustica rustica]